MVGWCDKTRPLESGSNRSQKGSARSLRAGLAWRLAGVWLIASAPALLTYLSGRFGHLVIHPIITRPINGVFVLATFGVIVYYWVSVRQRPISASFLLCCLIFLVPFVACRLWYFIEYPLPGIYIDSASYDVPARAILNGHLPNFALRPPLYPLLMAAVYAISPRVQSVIIVQNTISAIAGLIMIYCVYCWRRQYAVWTALAMIGFFTGLSVLEHDTVLMAESLYTSIQMVAFAFLLLALCGRRPFWLVSSALMACAILTKPAGEYLCVIYLLILGFMLWNRYGRRDILLFAIPFPSLLLTLCTYNYFTIHSFAISTNSELELGYATFPMWETSKQYPVYANEAVRAVQDAQGECIRSNNFQREALFKSWDPRVVAPIILCGYSYAGFLKASEIFHANGDDYRRWFPRIALDAIARQPGLFGKRVVIMLLAFYFPVTYPNYDAEAVTLLQYRAFLFYQRKDFTTGRGSDVMVATAHEYADHAPFFQVPTDPVKIEAEVKKRPLYRLYQLMYSLRGPMLDKAIWSLVGLGMFCVSFVGLLRSGCRDGQLFFVFVVASSIIGASLVVCLVEYAQPRYSYPLEWGCLMVAVMFPWGFKRERARASGLVGTGQL